jgi:hypothetical protein
MTDHDERAAVEHFAEPDLPPWVLDLFEALVAEVRAGRMKVDQAVQAVCNDKALMRHVVKTAITEQSDTSYRIDSDFEFLELLNNKPTEVKGD